MQQVPSSTCGVMPDACVVSGSGGGLQYGEQYGVDPYAPPPHPSVHHPSDFTQAAAMYVNTVWAPEQAPSHPSQSVYYEAYPGAAAMYGYPGHMIAQENPAYPGMQTQQSESGKRKRKRVISYEQRKAANVRERKRMCHLNDAFDVLRKRVPTFAYEKKLSRIETLKLAVTYIQYMAELLDDISDGSGSSKDGSSDRSSTGGGDAGSTCSGGERSEDAAVTSSPATSTSSAISVVDE